MDELQKAKENRDRIAAGVGAKGYDEACHKVVKGYNWLIQCSLEPVGYLGELLGEAIEEDLTDLDYIW